MLTPRKTHNYQIELEYSLSVDRFMQGTLIRGLLRGGHGIRTRDVSYLIIMAAVTQCDILVPMYWHLFSRAWVPSLLDCLENTAKNCFSNLLFPLSFRATNPLDGRFSLDMLMTTVRFPLSLDLGNILTL